MDVVFVIDSSGSMAEYFEEAVGLLRGYFAGLAASGAADFRFALVDYRDFPGKTTYGEDYPYKVQTDFTDDLVDFSLALGAMGIGYGGDQEESVYSALVDGLSGLSWREGAARAAVLIGDAAPLDPETETGYTLADAIAALRDLGLLLHTVTILPDYEPREQLGEPDDNWYGPGENPGGGTVLVEPAPFAQFVALAEAAGGLAVLMPQAPGLLDTLIDYAGFMSLLYTYGPNLGLPESIAVDYRRIVTAFAAVDSEKIRWESSDPSVAAIDGGGSLTYVFRGIGTATVRAFYGDTLLATVRLDINTYEPNLGLPGSMNVSHSNKVTAFSAVDDASIRWESSNPAVAAIDNGGNLTYVFHGIGTATVRAYAGVTLLATVQLNVSTYEANLGLQSGLTIYRKDAVTAFSAVDSAAIRWESSNPKALAIDDSGRVTYQFAKIGEVTIRAYDGSALLATVRVQIKWRWWQWILVVLALGWIYL